VTSAILICVVVQLVVSGLHELSEARVLPSSRWEMAVIGPVVSNDVFFLVAILALAAWMVLFDWRSRQAEPGAAALAPAERRKQQWVAKRERLWTAAVCASSFVFILLITAEYLYAKNQTALSPALSVEAVNGEVLIAVDGVPEGVLQRFVYQGTEGTSRFIVFRSGERLAAALDACSICGSQGYYQSGTNIFCRNCSAAIYAPSIGVTGGCNPIPVRSTLRDNHLVIQASDLMAGRQLFPPEE
jgi:uncharacterized membrane protein